MQFKGIIWFELSIRQTKDINMKLYEIMLFAGWEVHIKKNCAHHGQDQTFLPAPRTNQIAGFAGSCLLSRFEKTIYFLSEH